MSPHASDSDKDTDNTQYTDYKQSQPNAPVVYRFTGVPVG